MAIINRLSRLFKADFNAVLDNLEEPEILLRHSIREMQEQLERDELQIRALDDETSASEEKLADINTSIEQLGQELDVCFESGEEDLARKLVRRKLEYQQLEKYLVARIERNRVEWQRQTDELNNNKATLAGLQQKAELLGQQQGNARTGCAVNNDLPGFNISQDEVDVAFLQERTRRASA